MTRTTIAVLLLSGCFSPQYQEGILHCAANGQCPEGYRCYSTLCYTHEPVVVTPDASMPEAGPDVIPEAPMTKRQLDDPCDVFNARTVDRADNCDVGLVCVEGNATICMQVCHDIAGECGQARCEQRQLDPLGAATALVCGRPTAACDPTIAIGPTNGCASGRVCYLDGTRTICDTQSGDRQNVSCLYSRDCLPKYTCAVDGPGGGHCEVACMGSGGACPGGLSCLVMGDALGYCF